MNDHEKRMKEQEEKISQYIAIFEKNNYKTSHHYNHGFNVIINDYQCVFIRHFDYKGSAVLSFNSTLFKNVYIKNEMRRKEIGFSSMKEPQKLFDDITKRLLASSFAIEQFNYLESQMIDHNKYEHEKNIIKESIEAIKLDTRLNSSKDEFMLYLENGYGRIDFSPTSMGIHLNSIDHEKGLKILTLLKELE
jgi:hypothetical protein